MSRAFCIPGVIFLLCALVLNFLVSVSLPYLPDLDIVRTHVDTGAVQQSQTDGVTQIRFGIWAPCFYNSQQDRTCLKTGHGYAITVGQNSNSQTVTIGSSWTRGLAVHPVATAATFFAFCFSLSTHLTLTLIASLISFLAATLTLIAFAIDIALLAYVRHQMNKLGEGASTNTAPAFWMTFVSLVLLLLGGCTVCFGRRRDRLANATTTSSYPMTPKRSLWQRIRRKP